MKHRQYLYIAESWKSWDLAGISSTVASWKPSNTQLPKGFPIMSLLTKVFVVVVLFLFCFLQAHTHTITTTTKNNNKKKKYLQITLLKHHRILWNSYIQWSSGTCSSRWSVALWGVSMGHQNKPRVASSRVKQTITVSQFPFSSKSACRNPLFTNHRRVGILGL